MGTRHTIHAVTLATFAALAAPATALGQDPAADDIRPAVMLLVDTSGSMERLPSCECTTASCDECYPSCQPDASGEVRRSKWHMLLEALTGTWPDFACERVERPIDAYDAGYPVPHFNHPGAEVQSQNGIIDAFAGQALFGLMTFDPEPTWAGQPAIVDADLWDEALSNGRAGGYSYGPAVDYGFPGCGGAHRMNDGARSEASPVGPLISTGVGDPGVNEEVQAALLGDGRRYEELRPFGATPLAGMLADLEHYLRTSPDASPSGDPLAGCRPRYAVLVTDGAPNADMREAPFDCRVGSSDNPYGCPYELPEEIVARLCALDSSGHCTGSLAGVFVLGLGVDDGATRTRLDDLADLGGTAHAYFAGDGLALDAALAEVLGQAAVTTSSRTAPAFSNAGEGAHAQFDTGFRRTASGAWEGFLERRRFACPEGGGEPVPLEIEDRDRFHEVLARQANRRIWSVLPDDPCQVRRHLTGPTPEGLASIGFSGNLASTSGSTTRTGGRGGRNDVCGEDTRGNSHSGRNRVQCPVPPVSAGEDAFTAACGTTRTKGGRTQTTTTSGPAASDLGGTDLTSATSRDYFFVGTDRERDAILGWLRGEGRANPMGAIVHSTPLVVEPPSDDIGDESYNLFRRRPEVANRPSVMYFGTSDGILHCVSTRDQTAVDASGQSHTLVAGEELWGFVPPALLPMLQSARVTPQPMVDGAPMARDVFFRRAPGQAPDGSLYHTVLVSGFREGGAGYVALDVTNPFDPKFLWQFVDEEMGSSYGTPGLAQVTLRMPDGSMQERSIAMLPGGGGDDVGNQLGCGKCYVCDGVPQLESPTAEQVESGACALNEPLGCATNGLGTPPANNGTIHARENKRCWGTRGRQLFFVDPASGELVDKMNDSIFGAPIVGGIAVFPGDVGSVATAAYTTDADGTIWRIDLTGTAVGSYRAAPLFDMFWNEGSADGQPAFDPPIVTADPLGNAVILQATGYVDLYDHFVRNKIVSITERFTASYSPSTTTPGVDVSVGQVGADLNWQITLDPGEQVTGQLALFAGQVYFATFRGMPDRGSSCAGGSSRLWGVHYLNAVDPASETSGNTSGSCIAVSDPANTMPGVRWPAGVFTGMDGADAAGRCIGSAEGEVITGLTIAQRATCSSIEEAAIDDPFVGPATSIASAGSSGGRFELVAHSSGSRRSAPGAAVADFAHALHGHRQFTRATGGYVGHVD